MNEISNILFDIYENVVHKLSSMLSDIHDDFVYIVVSWTKIATNSRIENVYHISVLSNGNQNSAFNCA